MRRLPLPVGEKRFGANNQSRTVPTIEQEVREHLHGLTEPHFVGQDAAEILRRQRGEPADASALIITQPRSERTERLELAIRAQDLRGANQSGTNFFGGVSQVGSVNFLKTINSRLTLARIGVAQDLLEILECVRIKHRDFSVR